MFKQVWRKMEKILVVSPEKCSSCRSCELACSFAHEDAFDPSKSRVHAFIWERLGLGVPLMCMHCEDAPCMKVCPTGALERDLATNGVLWLKQKCIGCKLCVSACPFGNINYDVKTKRVLKCDLCDGDPACAKACPNAAIEYKYADESVLNRKAQYAAKFKKVFEEVE